MVKSAKDKGVAIIEFLIALPVLIIIIIIIIDGGGYLSTYFRLAGMAWDGTRMFSSISNPAPACFSDRTTNLAWWDPNYILNLSKVIPANGLPSHSDIFASHVQIHRRVIAEFMINSGSWRIKSDNPSKDIIPDGTGLTVFQKAGNNIPAPTIRTEFRDRAFQSPNRYGCTSQTNSDNEFTVGVCLSTTFQGMFFNIPVSSCSYALSLLNNEGSFVNFNGNFNFNTL